MVTGSIHYADHEMKVTYSGATAKYSSDDEDSEWGLAQFHYHAPAEHRIDGVTHDLEMHSVFVNKKDPGQLLVVGVIYELEQGYQDDELISALRLQNLHTNPMHGHIEDVPLENYYKKYSNTPMYNYKGSLTTPPCTEAVEWFVVKEIAKINPSQLGLFTSKWAGNGTFAEGKGTNRVAMDINRRKVYLTGGEGSGENSSSQSYIFSLLFAIFIVISVVQISLGVYFTLKLKNTKGTTNQKTVDFVDSTASEEMDELDFDYKCFQRSRSKEI